MMIHQDLLDNLSEILYTIKEVTVCLLKIIQRLKENIFTQFISEKGFLKPIFFVNRQPSNKNINSVFDITILNCCVYGQLVGSYFELF
jgi:hypothetical protein